MKNFRAQSGPFRERPFYELREIERICEDALRRVSLLPSDPSPIRIERFVEKYFRVTPAYEDLDDGVLGFTQFGPTGVQAIVVARALDEDGTKPAERRIRTTLAHEAGHGLLHAHLFTLAQQSKSLFGDFTKPNSPKVLCRDIPNASAAHLSGYDKRWWEYQANRAIGAFLLPRTLVEKAVDPLLSSSGLLGSKTLDASHFDPGAKLLADTFDVNPVVARIRLQEMYPHGGRQLHL
jgi:hypothetical protein